MTKVFLICGKICSGKTVYAEQLRIKHKAILLSVDEIMLSIFGLYTGSLHDEYTKSIKEMLLKKTLEIIEVHVSVILDWGFWTKKEREYVRNYFKDHHIEYEFYYIDIPNEEWKKRIEQRNYLVQTKEIQAYFVDENLLNKTNRLFEIPDQNEIDLWIKS